MAVIGMMAAVAIALTTASSALADGASPLGPDAQLFGLLAANGSLTLIRMKMKSRGSLTLPNIATFKGTASLSP